MTVKEIYWIFDLNQPLLFRKIHFCSICTWRKQAFSIFVRMLLLYTRGTFYFVSSTEDHLSLAGRNYSAVFFPLILFFFFFRSLYYRWFWSLRLLEISPSFSLQMQGRRTEFFFFQLASCLKMVPHNLHLWFI